MQRILSPLPVFFDTHGEPLNGSLYIGTAEADPETSPLDTFKDQALTIPIAQPLKVLAGIIVDGANAVSVFIAEADYSFRSRDLNGVQIVYMPSTAVASTAYQPMSGVLTAIAALATTAYGRALLTLANQTALQAAVGLPASLPLIGGTVTGNIVRGGAGIHPYFANAAMTGGRIYGPDPIGTADATSQPGDEQDFY